GAVPPQEEYEAAPEPAPARSSGAVAPGLLTQIRVRAVQSAKSLLETAASVLGEDAEGRAGARTQGPGQGRNQAVSAPSRPGAPAPIGAPTPGGDYEIRIDDGQLPPAPWANVIANPAGGFLVTERGAGCTWAASSYFYRLTPWHNDPVGDPPGEVLYLRDEESGATWCPTPAPRPTRGRFTVRHAPGASTFEHERDGIATTLVLGLHETAAVKLTWLRIINRGDRPRRLALTAYAEWTLGVLREHTQHQVQTTFDPGLRAILARNRFDPQFADMVAFCGLSGEITSHTADRREFLGRNGDVSDPAGLAAPLSGATGAGLDPCAALRTVIELAPGEHRDVAVVLGATEGEEAVRR
ncbi:MAG TPA: hypothetical protein VJ277_00480, partial [Gemmatimonadales bacterium]|nr:hypothetical protein [Gemmatimonadales bacterium]